MNESIQNKQDKVDKLRWRATFVTGMIAGIALSSVLLFVLKIIASI